MYLKDYARVNKRSWKSDEFRLRTISGYFGGYALREITPQSIERFRSERLRSGEARSTINRRMALLKRMLNLAIDWGYLKENPVCKIRFFSEKENERVRVLTEVEETRLLEACTGSLRPIIRLALLTGMRRGEILGMKWSDVDLTKNDIRIPHSKSGRPRFVPINQTLRGLLLGLRENDPKGALVFPCKSVRTAFENACKKAEIKEFTFHDLRRTFGTRLLERGVNIVTISRYYGHSSLLVTQRYLHPRDELNREAVERLNTTGTPDPATGQNLLRPCDMAEGPSALHPLTSTSTVN
jgi:integrase